MLKQLTVCVAFALALLSCGDGRLSPQGGSITGVTAGNGTTGGGASGNVTVNVVGAVGGGLSVLADSVGLVTTCSSGFALTWDGDSWECTDVTTAAELGTGTGGRSTRWLDSDTLATGAFTDDGTNASLSGYIRKLDSDTPSTYIEIGQDFGAVNGDFYVGTAGASTTDIVFSINGVETLRLDGDDGIVKVALPATAASTLGVTGLLTATAGVTSPATIQTTGTGDLVSADDLTVGDDSTIGDDVTDRMTVGGELSFFNGGLGAGSFYIYGGSINVGYNYDTDNAPLYVNLNGFNNSTTRYRDVDFRDGKGVTACYLTGSTKSLNCVGGLTEAGSAVLSGAITDNYVPKGSSGNLTNSDITATGTLVTVGDASTDQTDINGKLHVIPPGGVSDTAVHVDGAPGYQIGFSGDSTPTINSFDASASTLTFLNSGGGTLAVVVGGTGSFTGNLSTDANLTAGNARSDLVTMNGEVSVVGTNWNTVIAYNGGTTNEDTFIRAGKTAGAIYIGDPNTGGVNLGASGNLVAVVGDLTVGDDATISGGEVVLDNGTSNWVRWGTAGIAAPAFTTRSAGTKLVLYPRLDGTHADFALGIQSGSFWASVPDSADGFSWYAGTTSICTLSGAGLLNCVGGLQENGSAVLSGSITDNRVPMGSSGNLVDGPILGNDGGGGVVIEGAYLDSDNDLNLFGTTLGTAFISGASYTSGYSTNGLATTTVNDVGYLAGTTQFRNFAVHDGKNAVVATFTGSDKSLAVVGNLSTDANLVAGNATTDAHTVTGTLTHVETVGTAFSGANYNLSLQDNTAMAAGVGGALAFFGASTGTSNTDAAVIKAFKTNGTDGNTEFDLAFATRTNGGGLTEAMRIKSSVAGAPGQVNTLGNLQVAGNAMLGDSTSADSHTINGPMSVTSTASSPTNAFTVTYSGTGQTADRSAGNFVNNGSYNTTSSGIAAYTVYVTGSVTRSAGSNLLHSYGVIGTAAGAAGGGSNIVFRGEATSSASNPGYGGYFIANGAGTDFGVVANGNDYNFYGENATGVLYNAGAAQIDGSISDGNSAVTIADGLAVTGAITKTNTQLTFGTDGTNGSIAMNGAAGSNLLFYTSTAGGADTLAMQINFQQNVTFVGDLNDSNGAVTVGDDFKVTGNGRGDGDDTYFAWDALGNVRLGLTKKSGAGPKFAHGSSTSFIIAQSSGAGIEASNTFTDQFVIDTNGSLFAGDTASTSVNSNVDVLTIGNTGTGQTTSGMAELKITNSATYSTAGGSVSHFMVDLASTATESAGAATFTNGGIRLSVSGGDIQHALLVADGSAQFEGDFVGVNDHLAVGGTSEIADTFYAGFYRPELNYSYHHNWLAETDDLGGVGVDCTATDDVWCGGEANGATIVLATSSQTSPRGFSETVHSMTCTNGTGSCSGGDAEIRYVATEGGAADGSIPYTDARNKTVTFSVWLKSASGTPTARLLVWRDEAVESTTADCALNTSTWTRCLVTKTLSNTDLADDSEVIVEIEPRSTSAVYAWGAQLEESSTPTPYQSKSVYTNRGDGEAQICTGHCPQYGAIVDNQYNWARELHVRNEPFPMMNGGSALGASIYANGDIEGQRLWIRGDASFNENTSFTASGQHTFYNGPTGINTYGGTHLEFTDEWMFSGTTTGNIVGQIYTLELSGAGSALNDVGANGRVGAKDLQTGTSTTGRAAFATSGNVVRYADGAFVYEATVTFSDLSDVTNEYGALVGHIDTTSTLNPSDGCYFMYDRGNAATAPGTGDANSSGNVNKWKIWSANGGTRTGYVLDGTATEDSFTGIDSAIVASTWYRLKIVEEAAKCRFYINGTEVGRTTTNLSSTNTTGAGLLILKSAGTTGRRMAVDQTRFAVDLDTAR